MTSPHDNPTAPWAVVRAAGNAAFDEMLEDTSTLVRIPTVSAEAGPAMREGAEAVGSLLSRQGFQVTALGTQQHPLVMGTALVGEELPTLLVYGHYDVQPPGPLAQWHSDPFEPTLRAGRLFGRGTADSKGQLVAAVHGIGIARLLGQPRCNVIVLADGEEEIGSPNLGSTCAEHCDALASDLVMAVDGSIHPSGRPILALGSRGLLCLELVASDEREPLHSGNFGGIVPSPADRIAQAFVALGTRDGALVSGLSGDVVPPSREMLALIESLPAPEVPLGVPRYPASEHYKRLLLLPSFNISGVETGYVSSGFATTIPNNARARVDVRLVPNQDPSRLTEQIKDYLHQMGIDVEVRPLAVTPTTTAAPSVQLVASVSAALEQTYEVPPVVLPRLASTVPVSILSDCLNAPAVVVPHGNSDQNNHAGDENLVLGQLPRAAEAMARLLLTGSFDTPLSAVPS